MQFLKTARMSYTSTAIIVPKDYARLYHHELALGKKALRVADSVRTHEQSVVAIRYLERVIMHAQMQPTIQLCLKRINWLQQKFYQPKGNAPHENAFQTIKSNL